jgi:hypothetical protein
MLISVAALAGCSSRSTNLDDLDLFLRYKVDGTLTEYTTLANVFGAYSLGFEASLNVVAWDATSRLRLRVSSEEAIPGVGTHSVAQVANDSTFTISIYYQASDGTDYFAEPIVPEDATIVISSVGSSTIDGTFLGVVKAPGRPDVMITEGEFSVRREFDSSGSS